MASSYFKLKLIRQKRLEKKQLRNDLPIDKISEPYNLDNKTCRVCLKAGNIPIFGSSDLSHDFLTFTDVKTNVSDGYPKYLCTCCHSLLQGAIKLRKAAKKTDEYLQRNLPQNIDPSHESDSREWNDDRGEDKLNITTIKKIFRCKICKIRCTTLEEYTAHKNLKNHRNVKIQCSICYGVITSHSYNKHIARHESNSRLICEICGKLYRKDNLLRHIQSHSFELPFKCLMCPYRGRFPESVKLHMRTHTGDKPYSCKKCELRFLTRSNLNRHLLTHEKERPFKCRECERGFYTKREMDVHFKADHVGIKDFVCRLCGNKYGTRKAVMRHELRVHKRVKMARGVMPLYLQAEYIKEG